MNPFSPRQFRELIGCFCRWARTEERRILEKGVRLTGPQRADAERVGVRRPDRVRILVTRHMPSPEHPLFRAVAGGDRLIPPDTEALTLGYGVYLHAGRESDRSLLAHELRHVAQQEELGGLCPFFEKYLEECFSFGYPHGPMEREAMRVEAEFRREERSARRVARSSSYFEL